MLHTLVHHWAWALWLAAPVLATVLVSVAVWWTGRPARPASTASTVAAHEAFLAALVVPPRGATRPGKINDGPAGAPGAVDTVAG